MTWYDPGTTPDLACRECGSTDVASYEGRRVVWAGDTRTRVFYWYCRHGHSNYVSSDSIAVLRPDHKAAYTLHRMA